MTISSAWGLGAYLPFADGDYSDWGRLKICDADYMCVDDALNEENTWVHTTSSDVKELFRLRVIDYTSGAKNNISFWFNATRVDADNNRFVPFIKTHDLEYSYDIITASSSWDIYTFSLFENPATGQLWTDEELAVVQVGVKTLSYNPGAKVASVSMVVECIGDPQTCY
ncbi:MAG: hypothetical protein AABX05_05730 [Nanoarchaeota archaeon]